MRTKTGKDTSLTNQVRATLADQPGQSVKELALRLHQNRQFMAGVLAVLEERGDVSCRRVGPARIYFLGGGA